MLKEAHAHGEAGTGALSDSPQVTPAFESAQLGRAFNFPNRAPVNQVLILLPLRSERKTNHSAQAAGPVYKCPLTTGNHPTNAVARKHGLGIVTVGQQVVKAVLEKKTSQMKKPELPRSLRILAHR